jgi:hypothetical protein
MSWPTTDYSDELAAEICARGGGKSVAEIGRQADMPAKRTMREQSADIAA